MTPARRVIARQQRLFDDLFQDRRLLVNGIGKSNGTDEHPRAGAPANRKVAATVAGAAVHPRSATVALVEQSKAAGSDRCSATIRNHGRRLVEPLAGMMTTPAKRREPPRTAKRSEKNPPPNSRTELIGLFFARPCGTSERRPRFRRGNLQNADRVGMVGGIDDEDIKLLEQSGPKTSSNGLARGLIDGAAIAATAPHKNSPAGVSLKAVRRANQRAHLPKEAEISSGSASSLIAAIEKLLLAAGRAGCAFRSTHPDRQRVALVHPGRRAANSLGLVITTSHAW